MGQVRWREKQVREGRRGGPRWSIKGVAGRGILAGTGTGAWEGARGEGEGQQRGNRSSGNRFFSAAVQ